MIGLDWIGCALTLVGLWMLRKKNRKAFLVSIVANCFWIAYVLTAATLCVPLLIVNGAILLLNLNNYRAWGKPDWWEDPQDAEDFAFECDLDDRLAALTLYYGGLKNIPLPPVE